MTRFPPLRLDCPGCESRRTRIFHEARDVPVNSVLLLATREEAVSFPTADIRLAFCEKCGLIYNTLFDDNRLEYSPRYEETQGFSGAFRAWHEGLARRLIERYGLRGKKIVEIGCGKGEFLTLICELGGNRGVGFDPTYIPGRNVSRAKNRIEFIRDNYSEKYGGYRGDLLCCKMTLEHISDPLEFVTMVRRSVRDAPDTVIFFQVPDVLRILKDMAFWDIYYEHCCYYSAGSLARVFRRGGFEVLDVGREYDGQYLTIEARLGDGTRQAPLPQEDDLERLSGLVCRFAAEIAGRVAQWRDRLRQYHSRRCRTVIWGSGSKGVAFLTTLDAPGTVEYVVDINPNKHGYYMAKTGQKIVGPDFLRDYRPDVVVVMNPIYREEITAQLRCLDLTPEVIST
jgi:SAM-dependent methyltransferase